MIQSVCVFGDSVAKGVIFDSVHQKYILLKDSFLNLLSRAGNIAVNNYSKFGCTVTKGGEILKKHQNELCKYDFTVMEFGGNDCDFDWAEVSVAPENFHIPKTPVSEFEARYSSMIDQVKRCGGSPVLLSLPPIDAKRYFTWISRGLNAENILRFLGDIEYIYRWHEMYNLAVYRLAIEHHVPLIDISSAFLKTENYQSLICEDGIHPNENGHKLIGSTIASTLREKAAVPA
ncbi:MAG: SGNH/GDSL hydrolase family protein [Clostridiales bacterium]|jgi:lysophospholipase L1-like esterase|nr:SGNH/GDSL hydrolase family protein [Clostridiales bacterium]